VSYVAPFRDERGAEPQADHPRRPRLRLVRPLGDQHPRRLGLGLAARAGRS
jgi:hypothetical protein